MACFAAGPGEVAEPAAPAAATPTRAAAARRRSAPPPRRPPTILAAPPRLYHTGGRQSEDLRRTRAPPPRPPPGCDGGLPPAPPFGLTRSMNSFAWSRFARQKEERTSSALISLNSCAHAGLTPATRLRRALGRRGVPEPRASRCPFPHSQQRREGSTTLLMHHDGGAQLDQLDLAASTAATCPRPRQQGPERRPLLSQGRQDKGPANTSRQTITQKN